MDLDYTRITDSEVSGNLPVHRPDPEATVLFSTHPLKTACHCQGSLPCWESLGYYATSCSRITAMPGSEALLGGFAVHPESDSNQAAVGLSGPAGEA